MLGRSTAAVVALVGLFALPAAAQAATKRVWAGTPPSAQKTFMERYLTDVNDYFPHTTTIRVGDTVSFAPAGFHNVGIPAGDRPFALFAPTGQKVTGVTDAAGSPFWFNGQDQLGFSPQLVQSNYGNRVTYDGSQHVDSGLPLAEKPKPMRVRFTKPGKVNFFCSVHPGMRGSVRVRRRSAPAPSSRAHARAIRRQIARDLAIARRLVRQAAPSGVMNIGQAGRHGVEHLDFVPKQRTVPVGTTLQFRMHPRSLDVHTATTGPGDPENQPTSYLGQLTASLESPQADPRALYPSEPPGSPTPSLTATTHGNGFWNTGVLDAAAATPLPSSGSVTFGAPGTYTFYCLIHPFMKATVTAG